MQLTLSNISKFYPTLSADEELELAKRLKHNNDLEAAHKLVLHYYPLVIRCANRYRGYGLPFEDIMQEGVVGLMKAVKSFDYTRNVRLMSFAIHSIKAEIAKYVVDNFRLIKIASTKEFLKLFWNREVVNSDITELEKCELLKVTPKQLQDFETRYHGNESVIDDEVLQVACKSKTPEEHLLHSDEQKQLETLKQAVERLDERSAYIIRSRWLTEEPKTFYELSAELGVTHQRVAQIEKAALKSLKGLYGN
jgi:RNA polymerase sigma-32 factor